MVNISICPEYNNAVVLVARTNSNNTQILCHLFCIAFCCIFSFLLLVQPVQELRREVRQDQCAPCGSGLIKLNQDLGNKVPTCSQEGLGRLERHRLEVIHAGLGPSDDHGKLPADLVDRQRVIRSDLGRISNYVEVWHARFDHDDVGTFVDVPSL